MSAMGSIYMRFAKNNSKFINKHTYVRMAKNNYLLLLIFALIVSISSYAQASPNLKIEAISIDDGDSWHSPSTSNLGSVEPNESFWLDVRVKNEGSSGSGYGDAVIWAVGYSDVGGIWHDNFDEMIPYPAGSTKYHKDGYQISTQNASVDASAESWSSGQTRTMAVYIDAPSSGTITFWVRAVFSDYNWNIKSLDPQSFTGSHDNQGYYVYKYTVDVGSTLPPCSVNTPDQPSGPTTGVPDQTYTYTTSDSSCSCGSDLQYRFWWEDHTGWNDNGWSASSSINISWPEPGTYEIDVAARCSNDTDVTSSYSDPLVVTISQETGSISADIKNASGQVRIQPSDIDAVLLHRSSDYTEQDRREGPSSNPVTFENIVYGTYYFDLYLWDMFAGNSGDFTLDSSNKTVTFNSHFKRPLRFNVKYGDGQTPYIGAYIYLDSWDAEGNIWTQRADGITGSTGGKTFHAWPTTKEGEKYRVRVKNVDGEEVYRNEDIKLNDSSDATEYNLVTSEGDYGNIQVIIQPYEAIQDGAQWRLLDETGGEWKDSDDTILYLPEGDYVIEFKSIENWNTPAHKVVEVIENETVFEEVLYTQIDTLIHSVPYYNQRSTDWCAYHSLAMLAQHYGSNVTPWEIVGWAGKTRDEGMSRYDISEAIGQTGVPSPVGEYLLQRDNLEYEHLNITRDGIIYARTLFWRATKKYIESELVNSPLFFGVIPDHPEIDSAHAVVLTGISTDGLYLHDPSGALFGYIQTIDPSYIERRPEQNINAFVSWDDMETLMFDTLTVMFFRITSEPYPNTIEKTVTIQPRYELDAIAMVIHEEALLDHENAEAYFEFCGKTHPGPGYGISFFPSHRADDVEGTIPNSLSFVNNLKVDVHNNTAISRDVNIVICLEKEGNCHQTILEKDINLGPYTERRDVNSSRLRPFVDIEPGIYQLSFTAFENGVYRDGFKLEFELFHAATDSADLETLAKYWLDNDCHNGSSDCYLVDFNDDGTIDFLDFTIMAKFWLNSEVD